MADAITNFAAIQNDAVSYWVAARMYTLAERTMLLGQFATPYQLPQRLSKTLRVDRYQRFALPTATLTEGVPPDAVALSVEKVDVTVEQWGIVSLITDVANITTAHPALQIAVDRCGQAITHLIEREIANVLMAGTTVFYPGAVTSRAGIGATDYVTTATVIKATAYLRDAGAVAWEGQVYGGAMSPQVEGDLTGSDASFQAAQNFVNVRALREAEAGTWQGVLWARGNFLPKFKGQGTPDASAASGGSATGDFKPQITAVDGGGSITSATNFKFQVVLKDKLTDYDRHVSQVSANIQSTATGNNESFTVSVPAAVLTNYYYDVYMTQAGGSGSLYKVLSRQTTATSTAITTIPAGTETVAPAAPAATREVFTTFIFGKDAFGRVELNGMSQAGYLTPPGASWSNPLDQGRKAGSKVMFKPFILDNTFFCRIESASRQSGYFPS